MYNKVYQRVAKVDEVTLPKDIKEKELWSPHHSSAMGPTCKRVGYDSMGIPVSQASKERGLPKAWLAASPSTQMLPNSLSGEVCLI